MKKVRYYGTANGDVARNTESGIERYNEATREFVPSEDETIYDIETSMRALTPEEASEIMERSSKIADKLANAG